MKMPHWDLLTRIEGDPALQYAIELAADNAHDAVEETFEETDGHDHDDE
jgi:hypothetical protein